MTEEQEKNSGQSGRGALRGGERRMDGRRLDSSKLPQSNGIGHRWEAGGGRIKQSRQAVRRPSGLRTGQEGDARE